MVTSGISWIIYCTYKIFSQFIIRKNLQSPYKSHTKLNKFSTGIFVKM